MSRNVTPIKQYSNKIISTSRHEINLNLCAIQNSSPENPSLINIYMFGAVAQATYMTDTDMQQTLSTLGFNVNTIRDHNFLKSVCSQDTKGNYLIAFRGTNNLINWLRDDFLVKLTDMSILQNNISVHEGFWNALDTHWSDANNDAGIKTEILNDPSYFDAKFYVTGHSLGGGMAFLCALRLLDLGINPENIKLYTYGQPKSFGDSIQKIIFSSINFLFAQQEYETSYSAISRLMQKVEYYRVVNEDDLIPRLPPKLNICSPLGYTHFGKLVYLDNGTVSYPEEHSENIDINEWREHLMDPYLDNIELVIENQYMNGVCNLENIDLS
ncbi:MAG: lipase family protein [Rickettsiaceae bacterium]|nr:lipase family protein [Rickettsiaceae bacterium]